MLDTIPLVVDMGMSWYVSKLASLTSHWFGSKNEDPSI